MLSSLGLSLAMVAQVAATEPSATTEAPATTSPAAEEPAKRVYGPPAPTKAKPKAVRAVAEAQAAKDCADARQTVEDKTTIIVCGSPSEQYRLDRDVLKAEADRRDRRTRGIPPRQPGAMPDTGVCERSGGCRATEALNLPAVAMVLGQMAVKALRGENVGEMFVTNPNPSEYELYQMAKARREAAELDEAADAAVLRARKARAEKEQAAEDSVKPEPTVPEDR